MKNLNKEKITETLEKNYMPYTMSVIVSRAIPGIDGFKPAHRKLLYTMYKMGLLTGTKTKSANVVGQTMKLNPHGDMAIYETLVRLTRANEALLHPYIDSKGNFGKQYSRDMAFAASRYTEVKLDKVCEELFKDLDKNAVDFMDNYDSTTQEPVVFPTSFPNVLVNANQGIAVGMASNICSFNLREICEMTIKYIEDANVDICEYLKAPDFSTGGQLIYNKKDISEIYDIGKGSFRVRSKYKYDKKNNCIEIFEIPYTTTIEAIIDAVIDLVKFGKIKEISDVRDDSDLQGMKITIEIKKNTDADALMKKLFKLTPMEDTFSCNFNILINSDPKVMGIKTILEEWIKFRIECIKRQLQFDIEGKTKKLHLLNGLQKILLDIDKAIRVIRGTEKDKDVVPNLMEAFEIDNFQAEFVAEIKLRNLNKDYILNKVAEIENLNKEISNMQIILSNDGKIKKVIIKDLTEVSKKFGIERKTEIIQEEDIEVITKEHFIEEYRLKLFLTKEGYLKKIPLTSLRANNEHKLKDDDEIMQEIETNNKTELVIFTNKKTAYKARVWDLNDTKAGALGDYLANLLGFEENEKAVYMVNTLDYKGYLLFSFENGKVAKIDFNSYATKTNRKKLANAYNGLSPLADVRYISEDLELVVYSSIDKVLIYNTSMIAPKAARDSQGVQTLKPKKGSVLRKVNELNEVKFEDLNYYRTKKIPAIGAYLKETDKEDNQLTLEMLLPK